MRNLFYQILIGVTVLVGATKAQQSSHTDKSKGLAGNNKSYLTGKVLDQKTGSPLNGASIYFHESKFGTITDSNGIFKSQSLQAGKYLVEISFQGFATIIENIDITGKTEKNF